MSWIPSEAVTGIFKVPFKLGVAHYDDPPPDRLADVAEMVRRDQCRFCNRLEAFIEVEGSRVVGYGWLGDGHVGSTTLRLGKSEMTFAAFVFPTLRAEPILAGSSVIFRQTCGGRTGVPAPRPVSRPPFFQLVAPTAWSTLELEVHVDGRSEGRLVGASPFPRHWIYDNDGQLFQKSSLIDFRTWSDEHFGSNTPWGANDSPALVSAVETALERQLSLSLMRDGQPPQIKTIAQGNTLCEQGQRGDELYVLLDGVLSVEVDGHPIAEVGPGAVLGERALLEAGVRTSTLRALSACKVACAPGANVDRAKLEQLSLGHHRETETF